MSHDWSALFGDDVPGVVAATWTGGGAAVHFFLVPDEEGDGLTQMQRRLARIHGPSAALAGLARNDTLAIDGRNWRAVSQALANGHGLSQVYLEAL